MTETEAVLADDLGLPRHHRRRASDGGLRRAPDHARRRRGSPARCSTTPRTSWPARRRARSRSTTTRRPSRLPRCSGTTWPGRSGSWRPSCGASACSPGDRVASTLPNIPEAVIAMLAVTSIGAIWTSVSPDFGWRGVLDRFRQLQPTVLICTGGYRYNGKAYDRSGELRQIVDDLACLEHVIYLPFGDVPAPADDAENWHRAARPGAGVTGRVQVSPRSVRDAALDSVLQRHHRTAESDHPQPRRHPPRAAEAAAPEHEPQPRRRAVLLHHHRLDDVELHGQLARCSG